MHLIQGHLRHSPGMLGNLALTPKSYSYIDITDSTKPGLVDRSIAMARVAHY